MGAGAPRCHLAVLGGKPAEGENEPRVLDDRRPVGDVADHRLERADHAREDVLRRAEAVIADLVDAAAAEEQEAPQQAAGMMHAPRRRPAVGAAEDRAVAEVSAHARKLVRHGGERLVPGHLVKGVGAGARLALAPAVADRWPCDAQRGMHHLRDRVEHVGRRGVARERLAADHAAVLDQRGIGAPMGERGEAGDGHGSSGSLWARVGRMSLLSARLNRSYSTLTPVSCTALCQRARSRLTNSPNSSGVPPSGVKPRSAMRWRMSGSSRALPIAALILATMAFGVPVGTCRPFHEPNSSSGRPASATVGTSGRFGSRFDPVTASARTWPDFTCSITVGTENVISTRPPSRSTKAGATPL